MEANGTYVSAEPIRIGVPVETYIIHGTGHIGAFFHGGAVEAGIEFFQRYLR